MKNITKIISVFLCILIIIVSSVIPAFAAESDDLVYVPEEYEDLCLDYYIYFKYKNNDYLVTSIKPLYIVSDDADYAVDLGGYYYYFTNDINQTNFNYTSSLPSGLYVYKNGLSIKSCYFLNLDNFISKYYSNCDIERLYHSYFDKTTTRYFDYVRFTACYFMGLDLTYSFGIFRSFIIKTAYVLCVAGVLILAAFISVKLIRKVLAIFRVRP